METRFRKGFKYPEEDDEPEAMDEEEQGQLIAQLQQDNSQNNQVWIYLLLGLVLVSLFYFLFVSLFVWRSFSKLVILMGTTSFVATAYELVMIPGKFGGREEAISKLAQDHDLELGPLQKYSPYLNVALALLVGVSGTIWRSQDGQRHDLWTASWSPLIMYAVTFGSKRVMLEVDPDELEQAKYGWKGA